MKVEYNQEIEVTKEQQDFLKVEFAGYIAYRSENDKHYIKVWIPSIIPYIKKYLNLENDKI